MDAGLGILFRDQKYVIVEFLSRRGYKVSGNEDDVKLLHWRELYKILEPSSFGLTLPFRILVQTMGKENAGMFLKNRELYFDEWRFQQILDPRFPLENMNKMLRDAGQEEVKGNGRHLKRFGLKLDINELQ